jgi:ribonuclease G
MHKEILINSNAEETRVAILENKSLVELFIERNMDRGTVGNIYKGRVEKVILGMEAAFLDIGLKKDAFLYVADVVHPQEEYEEMLISSEQGKIDPICPVSPRSPGAYGQETEASESEGFSALPELEERSRQDLKWERLPSISDLLKEGQEVLVQVTKEPLGKKGARLTTQISLPGRYLVLMPIVNRLGISRRIENEKERERLREIIKKIRSEGEGVIVRTEGEGEGEEEFLSDIEFLRKLWEKVKKKAQGASAPALIHEDLDLIFRAIRDYFTSEVNQLIIDSSSEYEKVCDFLDLFLPHLKSQVRLYEGEKPLFAAYGLEEEISKTLERKVSLKKGGYLVIDETEALVAIDVNSGQYVSKKRLEDTILSTNLEAVEEIVRQIRLRNLGGIIIIDFIDMEKEEHKKKVLQKLRELLKGDRMRTNVLQLTNLGLVEMTRKRVRKSLEKFLCQTCPQCQGRGRIRKRG